MYAAREMKSRISFALSIVVTGVVIETDTGEPGGEIVKEFAA
jgi:hypothetical protein